MRKFIVKKRISLGYDSHVRQPTPTRYKFHDVGSHLDLDSESPSGNVWFIDKDGERGKIESGEVSNLTKDGRLEEL